MKPLKNYSSRFEADIAKGFLESHGIKAFVSSDDEGGQVSAVGTQQGALLSVADQDFEKASSIIEIIENSPPLKEGE